MKFDIIHDMLKDEDINKLKSVFATKEDFKDLLIKSDFNVFKSEVKSEFYSVKKDIQGVREDLDSKFLLLQSDIQDVKKDVEGLRESIQGMIVAVDNLAKVISDLRLEYAAISTQLTRHERWIKQIAEKVGLNLAME